MKFSLRSRVIAEWRGLPEKNVTHNRWAAPIDVLPQLMQRLGLNVTIYDPQVHYQQVRDAWVGIRTPDGR